MRSVDALVAVGLDMLLHKQWSYWIYPTILWPILLKKSTEGTWPRLNVRHFPDDILKCIFYYQKIEVVPKLSGCNEKFAFKTKSMLWTGKNSPNIRISNCKKNQIRDVYICTKFEVDLLHTRKVTVTERTRFHLADWEMDGRVGKTKTSTPTHSTKPGVDVCVTTSGENVPESVPDPNRSTV